MSATGQGPFLRIFTHELTKADYACVPVQERTAFFLLWQLFNDIVILQKQLLYACNSMARPEISGPEVHGATAMAILNLRLLGGRLYEGWKTRNDVLNKLFKDYEAKLSPESRAAWSNLKQEFTRDAFLERLRNKLGFHADRELMTAGFESLPEETALPLYIAEQGFNSLHFGAELVSVQALMNLTACDDQAQAIVEATKRLIGISESFSDVVQGFAEVFLERHFPNEPSFRPTMLAGLSDIEKTTVPYFFKPRDGTSGLPR